MGMWKHEILADLNIAKTGKPVYDEHIMCAENKVHRSVCFNVGDPRQLYLLYKKGEVLDFKRYNLPYNDILIEMDNSSHKDCLLVHNVKDEYWKVSSIHTGNGRKAWYLFPFWMKIYNNKNPLEIMVCSTDFLPENVYSTGRKEAERSKIILYFFLKLLSCKNISTEEIHPSEKVNKKRLKSGKLPLYSYHILKVNPFGAVDRASGAREKTDISHRLHFCRGHFKEFTPEKPLFGRHTGLYWWEPSLRGTNKDGFVDKDYEVQTV
jgi:hypothetical protein